MKGYGCKRICQNPNSIIIIIIIIIIITTTTKELQMNTNSS